MSGPVKRGLAAIEKNPGRPSQRPPRSLAFAQEGIVTANQFAKFMSGLISDLIEGAISPQVSNAAVNAGGKLLKVVEMQYKYGKQSDDGSIKVLNLIEHGS